MAVTRFAAVTDALLSTLRAAPALSGVTVEDGPGTLADVSAEAIYVGWSGDVEDDRAGTLSQNYHDLGAAATRDEYVDITVAVQVNRGDGDLAAARARCVVLVGAIESALRSNPSLGLDDVMHVEITEAIVRQARAAQGVGVEFDLNVRTTAII